MRAASTVKPANAWAPGLRLLLLAHGGPHVGGDHVGARRGLLGSRVSTTFRRGAGAPQDAGVGVVALRAREAELEAEPPRRR